VIDNQPRQVKGGHRRVVSKVTLGPYAARAVVKREAMKVGKRALVWEDGLQRIEEKREAE